MKQASTREEQMAAQAELQKIYKRKQCEYGWRNWLFAFINSNAYFLLCSLLLVIQRYCHGKLLE